MAARKSWVLEAAQQPPLTEEAAHAYGRLPRFLEELESDRLPARERLPSIDIRDTPASDEFHHAVAIDLAGRGSQERLLGQTCTRT
jgi:hypothetical protein